MGFFTRFSQKYLYDFFRGAQAKKRNTRFSSRYVKALQFKYSMISPTGEEFSISSDNMHGVWCYKNISRIGKKVNTKSFPSDSDYAWALEEFLKEGWIRYVLHGLEVFEVNSSNIGLIKEIITSYFANSWNDKGNFFVDILGLHSSVEIKSPDNFGEIDFRPLERLL